MTIEVPFKMLVVGMSKCGKTHYTLDFIERELHGVFDFIIIVCPTLRTNKTYMRWKYLDSVHTICCHRDDVEEVLEIIERICSSDKWQTLIIVDDCAASTKVKKQSGQLSNLGFSGRHVNISTIVLTQQFTSIALSYRENVDRIVLFYSCNKKTMQSIYEMYLGDVPKDIYQNISEQLRSQKYGHLDIDTFYPYRVTLSTRGGVLDIRRKF